MMKYKLLMVDDDVQLLKMLSQYFQIKGYEILTAKDGKEALEKAAKGPDLILLDVNMPRMDGLEVCRRIRDKVSCPILFLTARVEEEDRVGGLLSGGDDYIVKPFSLRELEARITAHLKREERHQNRTEYRFKGDCLVDYAARTVQIGEQYLELTRLEYEIVEFLSMHPGQVFDRERIYETLWGLEASGDSSVVKEHIRKIRQKLQKETGRDYIETVWGVGYRWKI